MKHHNITPLYMKLISNFLPLFGKKLISGVHKERSASSRGEHKAKRQCQVCTDSETPVSGVHKGRKPSIRGAQRAKRQFQGCTKSEAPVSGVDKEKKRQF